LSVLVELSYLSTEQLIELSHISYILTDILLEK